MRSAYEAFNRRDAETLLAMMHPDVDWPNAVEGGRVQGRDNVREYWRKQWLAIDPRIEPLAFQDDKQGRMIVDVRQVVRDLSGNVIVDRMLQHVYSIRDGLIERMEIRTADGQHTTEPAMK
ncbi:MAG TPA: nuclear transport factor 2 family protein [Candidatus Acidoferrales bacterium]